MTLQKQRRLLQFFSLLLLLGSFFFVWQAFQKPIPKLLKNRQLKPTERTPLELNAVSSAKLDPDSDRWKKLLRQPLYDPPPPPPLKVVKKELPPLRAKLLGTIIEPGGSKAMIGLPGNAVKFLAVGDALGDQDPEAVIDAIDASSIQVRRGEVINELTVDRGY